ncbi:hypothetical protein [Glaciimonas sp. PAMC28666]|uniref:hypothetical protein n=1 Tax=Glaciimonas sp. PAMC28666 TaxID=2807626 RepID=UPI001963F7A7|nr:hypothetical protein [Glaciimonas sp. PAMC28666]QRX82455.1 hypothetical protein JQN73_20635 [Glaciimonas sp. PAMC28666]
MRGRLGAVEEALAASRLGCVQLEGERAAANKLAAGDVVARPGRVAGKARGSLVPLRRRK